MTIGFIVTFVIYYVMMGILLVVAAGSKLNWPERFTAIVIWPYILYKKLKKG